MLSTISVPADSDGFSQLLSWAESFGQPIAFGIEETGSYGGALTSFVRRHGYRVVEVARPDRRIRRLVGKSDTIDARMRRKQ
ncbi:IS110 family transposase [Rhodococcus qingshengii]|uniref:IS110 family transposase n=1 Tax=Rhodococcus qingshengii TaxID=334542 RepID=UPI001C21E4E9|nr:IS110 family transposase [Rhodococcus qingshengii]